MFPYPSNGQMIKLYFFCFSSQLYTFFPSPSINQLFCWHYLNNLFLRIVSTPISSKEQIETSPLREREDAYVQSISLFIHYMHVLKLMLSFACVRFCILIIRVLDMVFTCQFVMESNK